MSYISFYTPSKTVEVHGTEYHYCGSLCDDIWQASLGIADCSSYERGQLATLAKIIPDGKYVKDYLLSKHKSLDYLNSIQLWLRLRGDETLVIGSKEYDVLTFAFNTALYLGSDSVKLAARISAQAPFHPFVEEANRLWLAEIIKQARKTKVFRPNSGWEGVIDLLTDIEDNPGPVVISWSGSDDYPDPYLTFKYSQWRPEPKPVTEADIAPSHDDEEKDEDDGGYTEWRKAYDELSDERQEELDLIALRAYAKLKGSELKPDNWSTFYFGHGLSAFDIKEYCERGQVDDPK